jgi:hypothetical protein
MSQSARPLSKNWPSCEAGPGLVKFGFLSSSRRNASCLGSAKKRWLDFFQVSGSPEMALRASLSSRGV